MKFRKKPVVIEAAHWHQHGDHPAVRRTSYSEVSNELGTSGCSRQPPYWAWDRMGMIDTPEGRHAVIPGSWIITGVKGEVYVCREDIFEVTYEAVKE